MAKPYFITTPIYYVNDVPHIGHAYTTVAADVFCRWKKQSGEAVLLTGTDEHGAKIQEAAEKHSKTPKEYADIISAEFKKAWGLLNIEYGRFIRTTDEDHETTAKSFAQKLYDGGYVKKGTYRGKYCVGHEKFMSDEELVGGKCPDHGRAPADYEEENYFFLLGKFRERLISLIESGGLAIEPDARKNEILGKLEQGLDDISISRLRERTSWGILLPWDNAHTMYVWVEALINYYTYGKPNGLWPADLHLVGKDILWFHSVIWPAMLLAIGEEPPQKVFAHGFFSIGGRKMSKTLGNVITPQQLADKFGVDGARYLLLSMFPFGADGDFDWGRLTEKYNADLANGVGNLASRVTTLAAGLDDLVLDIEKAGADPFQKAYAESIKTAYEVFMERLDFFNAIQMVQKLISSADQYINEKRPWELEGLEKQEVLTNLLGMLNEMSLMLEPFMPLTSKRIFDALGISGKSGERGGAKLCVKKIDPLFPRVESS